GGLFSLEEIAFGSFERMPIQVLDLAWPLSHTFMLVTGGLAIGAGVWRGWRRIAPFLPGLQIPMLFALMALGAGNGRGMAGYIQAVFASLAFLLLGYAVFTGPATKPSSDMEILRRSLDMYSSST